VRRTWPLAPSPPRTNSLATSATRRPVWTTPDYVNILLSWTPDPGDLMAVTPYSPQSWNRYAYVGNNPLSFVDSSGLGPCTAAEREDGDCGHQPNDAAVALCWYNTGGLCAGNGDGATCYVNGFASSCGWTESLVLQGLAAPCPENDCTNVTFTSGPGGTDIIRQYNPPSYWETLDPHVIHISTAYRSFYELAGDPTLGFNGSQSAFEPGLGSLPQEPGITGVPTQ
jgi:hypothetical protein